MVDFTTDYNEDDDNPEKDCDKCDYTNCTNRPPTGACCLNCKHSYIEDIWWELDCKLSKCNYERKNGNGGIN